ncbi:LCP family protein [Bacillaceae bacterium Marseille-Q3522]|nr:LCP family protein [Bacillaceae bacterium Marseille-Q3522]
MNKNKKKKKWIKAVLIITTFLFIGIGAYIYNFVQHVVSAVDHMNNPISRETSDKREEKIEFQSKDPISILLVGVDERDGDAGRTDSMLVMTVNPEKNSTKIVSIPRDLRTELVYSKDPSKNTVNKINHAYTYGGIEMSIESVEHFLNIPIDYYVEINMEGFKDIVDAVGGIEVYNKYAFELDGITLSEGQHHLNGEEALQYARMRKQDPLGDFGRQERQREVISKIIDKGKSFSTLTNYGNILDTLEKNVKTNFTLNELVGMQTNYMPAAKTIERIEIKGENQKVDFGEGLIWYYLVEDQTRQNLSNVLREHLNLDSETIASSDSSS